MSEIWNKYKDTVVTIAAEFIERNGQKVFVSIDGFFVDRFGHICTVLHGIQSNNKNLLFKDCEEYVMANKLSAVITSYNGRAVYEVINLEVVGTCGAADVAVLKPIVPKNGEPFTNQPHLKFGNHNDLLPGSDVFNIGDPGNLDAASFVSGVVRDNSWSYLELPYESVVTTLPVRPGNSGGIIINSDGEVFGMIQFVISNATFTGGIVSGILEFIVKKIIKGCKSQFIDENNNFISQYLNMSFGPYGIIDHEMIKDPSKSLQGQIVAESNVVDVPVASVITKANGKPVHTIDTDRITVEDILWQSRIGDKIQLTYKNASTNWKEKEKVLKVVKMPCKLNHPFSFLSPNSIVIPIAFDIRAN